MSKDVMITLLDRGANGNEILTILDALSTDDSGADIAGGYAAIDPDEL